MTETGIVERLRSVTEETMYQFPASVHAGCQSAASVIDLQQKAIDLLLIAIEPFANYHDWAKQWEWPAAVVSDSGTPVLGRENYDAGNPPSFTVTVGNFRAARSAKEQVVRILKDEK